MSIMEFLYLGGAIAAFLAFASVLAWGQYQTRNFVRPEERDIEWQANFEELHKQDGGEACEVAAVP